MLEQMEAWMTILEELLDELLKGVELLIPTQNWPG
ncbi:hypothetical protein SAMN05421759_1343 [Roseivivax lentus]|uniref:Uncharacterized protein n=1 Tax=Roseivivax lentus TaxID=633194 RepID=A0A1N7Q7A0_9RHOB|nr:hypothetical protein SAMN05421759_1343 [Roseivivax lentus]